MIKTELMSMPGFVPTEQELLQVLRQKAPCCSCPQRSVVPSEMAHTSFLITPAQTSTATRTANPPTMDASTEMEYLFKHKLLLRHPFMGFLLVTFGKEGHVQNLSHCLFAEVIPSMQ